MKKSHYIFVMVFVLSAGGLSAEELVIELDLGTQIGPGLYTVTPFTFDIPLEQINLISLRLEGTYRTQQFTCGSTPGMILAYAAGRFRVLLGDDAIHLPDVAITHQFPGNDGDPLPYDLTFNLMEGDLTSWDFLADGSSQVGVDDLPSSSPRNGSQTYFNCLAVTPSATISSAILTIGYDEQVPVAIHSWGAIKAIYR